MCALGLVWFLFWLLLVNVFRGGAGGTAPIQSFGFLAAHRTNSVRAEKEDKTGSYPCWHRLALCTSPCTLSRPLPCTVPVLLVTHCVRKCLVVDTLWEPEHWPFLHLWPLIPLAMLEGQEASGQQGPRQYSGTCRAHTGRRAVLTSVADFIRLRSLTGIEFMWK